MWCPLQPHDMGVIWKKRWFPKESQDISFLGKVNRHYMRKITNAYCILLMPIVLFCLPLLLSNQQFFSFLSCDFCYAILFYTPDYSWYGFGKENLNFAEIRFNEEKMLLIYRGLERYQKVAIRTPKTDHLLQLSLLSPKHKHLRCSFLKSSSYSFFSYF